MSADDAAKRITEAPLAHRGAARAPGASDWTSRLAGTALRRAPYAALYRNVLAEVLERHSSADAVTVELGAGAGQLRAWLEPRRADAWLHTEPDARALEDLRRRCPDARTARASAESVPVAGESVDTTLGLCVLDVVADLERVAYEQLRVLKPGGCFVHLLDMTTALDGPLTDLFAAGFLAVPNLLSDPTEARWPADLLLAQRRPFQRLFQLMRHGGHPHATLFEEMFAPFFREPFDGHAAARAFLTLSSSPELRGHLLSFMIDAERVALDLGLGQMHTMQVSSARHFATRLEKVFARAGFEISRSDIGVSSLSRERPAGDPHRYRGNCVGHERLAPELPSSLLCPGAPPPGPEQQRLELGVFIFVARKPAAQRCAR